MKVIPNDRFLYGANVDQFMAQEEVTSTSTAGETLWALPDHLETVRDVASYDDSTNTKRDYQLARGKLLYYLAQFK